MLKFLVLLTGQKRIFFIPSFSPEEVNLEHFSKDLTLPLDSTFPQGIPLMLMQNIRFRRKIFLDANFWNLVFCSFIESKKKCQPKQKISFFSLNPWHQVLDTERPKCKSVWKWNGTKIWYLKRNEVFRWFKSLEKQFSIFLRIFPSAISNELLSYKVNKFVGYHKQTFATLFY